MISVDDPQVFNKWRAAYDSMSSTEHLAFANAAEKKWPDQKSFKALFFEEVFRSYPFYPLRVLEVGGWKGELAKISLERVNNIIYWRNVDFCTAALAKTVPIDFDRYEFECPATHTWFTQPRIEEFDVFVSAHMIEHLSDAHLLELLKYVNGIPILAIEAPITMEGQTWDNYYGTHILGMGWTRIIEELKGYGYTHERVTEHCFIFKK